MRFCTICGTPVSGTRTYCTHCGATIRRAPYAELEAAQVGVAAQATAPAPAAAEPSAPEPPSTSLPTTWLADFDQPPEPPAQDGPVPLPATPPASGRTLLAVALVAVLIAAGSAAWMAGSSRPRAGRHPS